MRYRFSGFEFDSENFQLTGPDGEVSLRPMTVRLLHALIENAPQLLRHDELLDQVWGRHAVTQGVLSQSIRELRQALGDSAQEPRFIETRHRLGYRFIAGFERIEEPRSEPASSTAQANVEGSHAPARTSASRWQFGWLVALVLAVVLAWLLWPAGGEDTEPGLRNSELVHDGRPAEPQALDWYRQGLRALRDGDLTTASERLRQSLQREPDSVATQAAMADLSARVGNIDEARRWGQSAEQGAAALPRAEQLRIAAFLARLDYRWTDAEAHLQALFQLNPGDAESGFRLADAQLSSGRLAEAELTLGKLQELDVPSTDGFQLALLRARLAAAKGNHQARLEAATKAAELAESADEHVQAGLESAWSQLLLGDRDAARKSVQRIRANHDAAPGLQLRMTMLEATLSREAGEYDASRDLFFAAAKEAERMGQEVAAARARREAAYVQAMSGDTTAAIETLTPVIEQLTTQGDVREIASAQDVMAIAQLRAGNSTAALESSQAALAAYQQAGDRIGEAAARNHYGNLMARSGRLDEAGEQWEAAKALFESLDDRRGTATALSNLSIVYGREGRIEAAREASEAALAAFREVGSNPDVARLQFNLGLQDRRAGKLIEAEARVAEALDAFGSIGARDFQRQAAATLAELRMALADLEGAAAVLDSLTDADQAGAQPRAALVTASARLAALQGDFESADTGFREAKSLRSGAGLSDWALMNALDLAELSARRGQLAASEQAVREVRRALLDAKDGAAALQAGILLAGVQAAQGHLDPAARLLDELESERNAHPDAMQSLRLDLVRAAIRQEGRDEALSAVAVSARRIGFELLALRADLLSSDRASVDARNILQQRGILVEGMPPPLPY